MTGAFGPYAMNREASGTSWQPEAVPLEGYMLMREGWMTMLHGYFVQVHDHQGGPRGAREDFAESLFMAMAQRALGEDTFGLRAMLSLDPAMGKDGYPLLLQTGETADGVHPLVDRQHPHDLFMELSASYSHAFSPDQAVFIYGGLPGEPALGPPSFMHRASSQDDPEAPLSHHWLDSTHVTYGVVTLGYIQGGLKLEASVFHGREPDQFRWNIESGRLDSASARMSWNPTPRWALQASRGYLHSPEELDPGVNQRRTTASAMHEVPFGADNTWATTFAWGQDDNRPGHRLDAGLAETELVFGGVNTLFYRGERVQEDELFDSTSPLHDKVYIVVKRSVGFIHDWLLGGHWRFGFGGLLGTYHLPDAVQGTYGGPRSYMLFARLRFD
ncbi:MAG TPA: hypothetical protein VLG68_03530 [Gammaproteobacteria bacterium]|nr:hypothetical protein [Gammaproteobacteria bacterium]